MDHPHAEYFAWFRACLEAPPPPETLSTLAERVTDPGLRMGHPDLAAGWARLEAWFDAHPDDTAEAAAAAHHALLGHPFEPRLDPYASVYRDGHRMGPSLVALRGFLDDLGLVAEREAFRDCEDHAIFLMDLLARFPDLSDVEGAYATLICEHVTPWMPRFLEDLEYEDEVLDSGGFYAGLARIARGILALEIGALPRRATV